MYLEVDRAADAPVLTLREADDFKAFKIVVRHGAAELPLTRAVSGVGTVASDGDVFLQIDAVKALAGDRARDPAWTAAFEEMLAYAVRAGWVSDDGQAIRAHVEGAAGSGPSGSSTIRG